MFPFHGLKVWKHAAFNGNVGSFKHEVSVSFALKTPRLETGFNQTSLPPRLTHQACVTAIISNLILIFFFFPCWVLCRHLNSPPLCKICKETETAYRECVRAVFGVPFIEIVFNNTRTSGGLVFLFFFSTRRAFAEFLSHDSIMRGSA